MNEESTTRAIIPLRDCATKPSDHNDLISLYRNFKIDDPELFEAFVNYLKPPRI